MHSFLFYSLHLISVSRDTFPFPVYFMFPPGVEGGTPHPGQLALAKVLHRSLTFAGRSDGGQSAVSRWIKNHQKSFSELCTEKKTKKKQKKTYFRWRIIPKIKRNLVVNKKKFTRTKKIKNLFSLSVDFSLFIFIFF